MGILFQNQDNKSELQTRLAAELREKVRKTQTSAGTQAKVEPELLADGEQTRPAGMIIAALLLCAIVAGSIWVVLNF